MTVRFMASLPDSFAALVAAAALSPTKDICTWTRLQQ